MDNCSNASEIPDLLQFLRPPVKTFYGHRPGRGDLERYYRNHRFGRHREERQRTELRSSSSLILKETTQTSTQREYRVSRGSVTDVHYPCQFFTDHSDNLRKYTEANRPIINIKVIPSESKPIKKLKRINQSARRNQNTTAFQENLTASGNLNSKGTGKNKLLDYKTPGSIADARLRRHLPPNDDELFSRTSWNFKRVISSIKMEMKRRKEKEELEQKHLRVHTGGSPPKPEKVSESCECSSKYGDASKHYTDGTHKSRVKITGKLGLTEDDKYVLRCAARIDDEPIETQCEYIDTNRDVSPKSHFFGSSKRRQFSPADRSVCADEDCPYAFAFRSQRTTYAQTDKEDELEDNGWNLYRNPSKSTQANFNFIIPTGGDNKSNQNDAFIQCKCKNPSEIFAKQKDIDSSKNPLVVISVYPKNDGQKPFVVNETLQATSKTIKRRSNYAKSGQSETPKNSSPKKEQSPGRAITPKKDSTPRKEVSTQKENIRTKDISPSKDISKREVPLRQEENSRKVETPKTSMSPNKINSPQREKSPASIRSKPIKQKVTQPISQPKTPKGNQTDKKYDTKSNMKLKTNNSPEIKKKVKTITTSTATGKLNIKHTIERARNVKKEVGSKAKSKISQKANATEDFRDPRKINQTKKALVESFTRELTSHLGQNELATPTPKSIGFSNVSVNIDGPNEEYNLYFSNDNFTIKKKMKNQGTQKKFSPEENNSMSMVNYLVDADVERRRSFSQTLPVPDKTSVLTPPSPIKVKDSIEISHRREDRANSQNDNLKVAEINKDYTDELITHYKGDSCPIPDPVVRDKEIRELLGVDKGRPGSTNNYKSNENVFFPEWTDYEIPQYDYSTVTSKMKRDEKIAEILNILPRIACQQEAKECIHYEMKSVATQYENNVGQPIHKYEVFKNIVTPDNERPISLSKKEFNRVKEMIQKNLSKRHKEKGSLRMIKKISRKSIAIQSTSKKFDHQQKSAKLNKRSSRTYQSKSYIPESRIDALRSIVKASFINEAASIPHNPSKLAVIPDFITRINKINELKESELKTDHPKPEVNKVKPEKKEFESKKMKTTMFFREDLKSSKTEKEILKRKEISRPQHRLQQIHINYAIVKSVTFSATSIPSPGSIVSDKSNTGVQDLKPKNSVTNESQERNTDCMGFSTEDRNSLKPKYSVHTLFKGKTRKHKFCATPNATSFNSLYPEEGSRVFNRPPKIKDSPSKEIKMDTKKPLLRRIWSYLVMRATKDDVMVDKKSSVKLSEKPSNSVDSYHINTSIDPRDIPSSIYDTSASFYTEHSVRPVASRMKKKTFLGLLKGTR